VSFWLAQIGITAGNTSNNPEGYSNLEGSPINAVFVGGLIVITLIVLYRRGFSWSNFASSNKAILAIYAFFLLSSFWSPFPVPTVKRVIQDFVCLLTGLVLLSQEKPAFAIRIVYARVSYILFPLSVIFIRYFPEIGRVYSGVSGAQMLSGVAGHKNLLGQVAMVFCLILVWDLFEMRKRAKSMGQPPNWHWPNLISLCIGLYLLNISRSATALVCFLLGLTLLFYCKKLAKMKNPRMVFAAGLLFLMTTLALEQTFGIKGRISEAFGRGSGMSGRDLIWNKALEKAPNQILGSGFRGFWETDAGISVSEELFMNRLLTAHNGYIEVYLHGGITALLLLSVWILSSIFKATNGLENRNSISKLAIVFWPIFLLYNMSESTMFQTGALWCTILIVTAQTPQILQSQKESSRTI